MPKNKTRQLVFDALLSAMCAVLAYLSVKVGSNFKVTFESVPILVGALLFGPLDGALVGLVGTTLYQVFFSGYGVTVTTPLWIAPYVICGLLVGLYAKRRGFSLKQWQIAFIIVSNELLITALNTGAIYVDSKIYGYYKPSIITGVLALRLIVCVVKAVAYAAVLPPLLQGLRQFAPQMRTGGVKA
ncbi:MAG: ECF transporter S component [Oscillospiraceae bacterium]|nr:ECF transporter S component [Oscillospiraceae bacterium]